MSDYGLLKPLPGRQGRNLDCAIQHKNLHQQMKASTTDDAVIRISIASMAALGCSAAKTVWRIGKP